jgi:hypothetical protein
MSYSKESGQDQDKFLPSHEVREDRMILARRFLEEVLVPHIESETLTAVQILPLYKKFQKENAGSGSDFSLAHTWSIANMEDFRNGILLETHPEMVPLNASAVAIAAYMLNEFADL